MRYNSGQIQYCSGTSWASVFAGGGPTFITPVTVVTNAVNDVVYTYDASASIPESATAVILEVSVASGSDVETKEAYLRSDASGPTLVLRSSTFNITQQVVCPITAARTFQYSFKGTSSSGVPGKYPANLSFGNSSLHS